MAVTAGTRENLPEIVVSVVNNASVDQKTILLAEWTASYIYRSAKISIAWRNCTRGAVKECGVMGDTRRLVLSIEPPKTIASEAYGLAFFDEHGNGRYCKVFYDRVLGLEHAGRGNQGTILGIIAAHELGHLLLGSHSHSGVGIMRPQLQMKDFLVIEPGVNTFNSGEAQRIADRLVTGVGTGSKYDARRF